MDDKQRAEKEAELEAYIEKLTPEEKQKMLEPLQQFSIMLESIKRQGKLVEAYNNAMKGITKLANAARVMQDDMQKLGVNSFTEGLELFPEKTQGAFLHILKLAREHIEAGLLLKDYADAINPDYTVKEGFLFKGELEQALYDAKDDILEYLADIEQDRIKNSRADKLQKAREARENAIAMGAIMTIDNHLAAPSAKDLMQLFTPQNVFRVKDFATRAGKIDSKGQLDPEELEGAIEPLDKLHAAFMMFIFQLVLLRYDPASPDLPSDNVSLYVPNILREELGIDARKAFSVDRGNKDLKEQRRERILELLTPFEDMLAKLPSGGAYRVCSISSYDEETEQLTLHVPYFFRLVEYITQKNYKGRAYSRLFHSTIANEQNTAAIELAARILAGVKQRGLHKDPSSDNSMLLKKTTKTRGKTKTVTEVFAPNEQTPEEQKRERRITYTIKWRSILGDCPQVDQKLNDIMSSDKANKAMYINKALKDIIGAAYRIIMEKSDAPQYYLDFTIGPKNLKGELMIPTKSTLQTSLVVSHRGKNPNYKEQ